MSIFRNFLKPSKFPELGISTNMASIKSWKSCQKQGIDFKPLHIMKAMRGVLSFKLGIGISVESFYRTLLVPGYVRKHLVLICLVAHGFSEMLHLPRKSILQELFAEKAGISLSLEKRIF